MPIIVLAENLCCCVEELLYLIGRIVSIARIPFFGDISHTRSSRQWRKEMMTANELHIDIVF